MAGEWREVAVEELKARTENALATGPFGSSISSRFFTDSGVPVIRGSNLSEDIGTRLKDDGLVFLSSDKAREFTRSIVRAGDLVFTCWGTVNQVGLIDGRATYREYVISNKQMKLTPDPEKADSLFLYYLFSSPELQDRIKNQSIGSSVPGFNLGQLRGMRINVPQVEEQQAIAHILGTLDDKIELNRRMNETLEAMARALFKSWFVDFDPVRAKAEGRARQDGARSGQPRQPLNVASDLPRPGAEARAGAEGDPGQWQWPQYIVDLFPARLVDSELGKIPEGWRASVLGEELTRCGGRIQTGPFGSQLHASDYVADGVPVVMPKDLSRRRVSTQSIARVNIDDAERLSRHRLQQGDIVYSRRGDVEQHGLVHRREAGWLCGTGCLLVRPGPKWASPLWVSIALDHPESRAWIVQHAIGATMPNLNTGILARVPLIVPPDEILWAFDRFARPLADKVISADAQTETLVSLRDALLPQLIAGELRVKDAEKFVDKIV